MDRHVNFDSVLVHLGAAKDRVCSRDGGQLRVEESRERVVELEEDGTCDSRTSARPGRWPGNWRTELRVALVSILVLDLAAVLPVEARCGVALHRRLVRTECERHLRVGRR